MKVLTAFVLTILLSVQVSSWCPNSEVVDVKGTVGTWYKYQRTNIALSTGTCTVDTIESISDTNFTLTIAEIDDDGSLSSTTFDMFLVTEKNGILYYESAQLGVLNALFQNGNCRVFGICPRDKIDGMMILCKERHPSKEDIDKIEKFLLTLDNIPILQVVSQDGCTN